jgi:hypothetical protein
VPTNPGLRRCLVAPAGRQIDVVVSAVQHVYTACIGREVTSVCAERSVFAASRARPRERSFSTESATSRRPRTSPLC